MHRYVAWHCDNEPSLLHASLSQFLIWISYNFFQLDQLIARHLATA